MASTAQSVRDGLRSAFRVLCQADMAPARDYVLNTDAAEDIAIACDASGLSNAVTIHMNRTFVEPEGQKSETSLLLLPTASVGPHSIGIGAVDRLRSGLSEEALMHSRTHGRYLQCESGELLFATSPVDVKSRPTIHVFWLGAPAGVDGSHRESFSAVCDTALFDKRRLLDSVEVAEMDTFVPISPIECDVCGNSRRRQGNEDGPVRKCLEHFQIRNAKHNKDFSHTKHNLKIHEGASVGRTFHISALRGQVEPDGRGLTLMNTESSFVTTVVGREKTLISNLLAICFEAHPYPLKEGSVSPACDTQYSYGFYRSCSTATFSSGRLNSVPHSDCYSTKSGGLPVEGTVGTTRARGSSNILNHPISKESQRERAALKRKMSNRASAARSNARLKEASDKLKNALADAKRDLSNLERRDQELREENLCLRRQMKSSGRPMLMTGFARIFGTATQTQVLDRPL